MIVCQGRTYGASPGTYSGFAPLFWVDLEAGSLVLKEDSTVVPRARGPSRALFSALFLFLFHKKRQPALSTNSITILSTVMKGGELLLRELVH